MNQVKHFRSSEMVFEPYAGPPGVAQIARLVGTEMSATMGAGVATFDDCSVGWTILYDELIVVLEGIFRLVIADETYEMLPGDVIWLPENTPLRYEGQGAKVFYAVCPVDWRKD